MSVKHVTDYYKKICEQYDEMLDNIRALEEGAAVGLVEPERIERLESQIAPIKQNYERWAYMMFLLNQPNKKDKIKKYKRQNANMLKNLEHQNSLNSVLSENEEALKHIGD